MELLGATFPLLIVILPKKYDAVTVQAMADAFRPYHARQQPFAVVHMQLKGVGVPTATERKLLTDWANSPSIRDVSARFCVVAAVVIPNPLNRGILTAINWVLKPVCPTVAVGTAIEGVDACLARLTEADVPLPRGADSLRKEALALLSARRDLADA
jgi:hypothetical protein